MEVHFILNPFESNIMVNATEMAKIFNKRIDNFLRLDETKRFIAALLESKNKVFDSSHVRNQITEKDLIRTTNKATFMEQKLAIYFAFWLDVKFQIWLVDIADEIMFGNYKKHWDAHTAQEQAKERMIVLKDEMLRNPTAEIVEEYFRCENVVKSSGNEKRKAIQSQIHLFNYLQNEN